jgi:zinc transport system substrate-binding protein
MMEILMMKKIGVIAIAGLAMTVRGAELKVWCGIPPLVSVVNAVGGDRVQVQSLMSSTQDPHTWSPSPKSVAGIRDADLFFTIGLPFEQTVAQKISGMNSMLRVVDAAAGFDTARDPHIWLSLPNLSALAGVVSDVLAEADPAGEPFYRQNCAVYQQRLQAKNVHLKQMLEPLRGKTFFVYHPVFGYFASDYGLKQGVVELEGKSPAPKQLLALINRARDEQVRVVFVQPQFNDNPARILTERIGGQVVPVNPLAEDTVAVIEQAAESIAHVYAPR